MKILCQRVNKCCYCLQIKQYNELADNNVLDKAEHIETSEDWVQHPGERLSLLDSYRGMRASLRCKAVNVDIVTK